MRKKILIFSLAYLPKFVGGAEIAVKEITDRTPDIEFHMVTLRLDPISFSEEKVGNIVVHRVGLGSANMLNKFLFQFLAPWKALSLHHVQHFDCVWAVMAHSSGVPAALFKFFKPNIPYVLTLQEGDPSERIERLMLPLWPLFSRAFKTADIVQAISVFLGKWARRRGFRGPLEIVPNGVDVGHFSEEHATRTIDEIKDKLGKRLGDVFLVTTSRLVEKNALDDVIYALPLLPKHVRFIVIGTGPDNGKLKMSALKLGVSERVRFVGHIDHDIMPKYLKACDIFIRPSRSEGMGNSFIEAMAAGLPVIATQEGGIADFLFDEKRNPDKPITGFAVDKDSPEQIAAQVKNIIENQEKVRAVIATAYAIVKEKYSWNIVATHMREKVFNKAFKGSEVRKHIFIATPFTRADQGVLGMYAEKLGDAFVRMRWMPVIVGGSFEKNAPLGLRHLIYTFRILPKVFRSDYVLALDTWGTGFPAFVLASFFRKPFAVRIGGDFLWESYVERTKNPILLSEFYETKKGFSFKEKLIQWGARVLAHRAKALLFTTRFQRDLWKKAYELSRETHIVENYFPPLLETESSRRRIFVSAGRKIFLKNAGMLERVFKRLAKEYPDIELDTEALPHKEHLKRLEAAYAVIIPTFSEVCSNTAIEAALHGKPFVMTRDTGTYERLSLCGLFIDTREEAEIERAIKDLLDKNTYERLVSSIHSFSFVHTWDDIAKEIRDIFIRM